MKYKVLLPILSTFLIFLIFSCKKNSSINDEYYFVKESKNNFPVLIKNQNEMVKHIGEVIHKYPKADIKFTTDDIYAITKDKKAIGISYNLVWKIIDPIQFTFVSSISESPSSEIEYINHDLKGLLSAICGQVIMNYSSEEISTQILDKKLNTFIMEIKKEIINFTIKKKNYLNRVLGIELLNLGCISYRFNN